MLFVYFLVPLLFLLTLSTNEEGGDYLVMYNLPSLSRRFLEIASKYVNDKQRRHERIRSLFTFVISRSCHNILFRCFVKVGFPNVRGQRFQDGCAMFQSTAKENSSNRDTTAAPTTIEASTMAVGSVIAAMFVHA